MADLVIPEEYERGFVEIRTLEEDQVHELVAALKGEPPTRNYADLQRKVKEKVDSKLVSSIDEIMETLLSLYGLRDSMGLELPEFVEVLGEMIDESYMEELKFTNEEEREAFKAKLIQFLSVDSLDITARAADILYERERTVHGLPRVFTDIRPIFGPDAETSPRGALIIHTLKINYHERGRVRELFLALNDENINELIEVLNRANLKAESTKEFLEDKSVPYISPE